MRKTAVLVIFSLFIMTIMAVIPVWSETGDVLTNLDFAKSLVQKLGIQLPAGTDKLPPGEYFAALANVLATAGIKNFINANPNDVLTVGQMAEVLYTVVGGKETLDISGKVNYLVSKGYMSAPADLNSNVTLSNLQNILDNPDVSTVIAETYTPPAEGAAAPAPGEDAPNPTLENPSENAPAASPI